MDWYEIAERDHEIQNPTSAAKIRLLGEYTRLGRESRVLDIASGKAGPALVLASTFGCHVTGVELRTAFADEARRRIAENGLDALMDVHTADAATFPVEPESWDAALCLGASFVWGNIGDAAAALVPGVKHGGFVVIGEPFWREWPVPAGIDDYGYVDLPQTVARFIEVGVAVTAIIAADEDEWDRYESLHWRALEEWLAVHPEADEFRDRNARVRAEYFNFQRALLGWAIFVGRKP
jgi:hypothetical protein